MKGNRTVRMMSIMVLVGLLAAHLSGQANMLAPTWLWLAAFASLMGLQATFTGFCPASKMLGDKSNGCCGS